MCTGREFQVDDTETEKAREEMLLVIPDGLTTRFVLVERKDLNSMPFYASWFLSPCCR